MSADNGRRRHGRATTRGAAGGELALIDSFLEPFGLDRGGGRFPRSSGVLVGPGDDCAQLRPSPGMTLIATTDALVEGVHFDPRWSSPEDAGWKALAVNLSDLAAAGAKPRWFLCALGVPRRGTKSSTWNFSPGSRGDGAPRSEKPIDIKNSNINQLANRLGRGMSLLARASKIALAGGNVTASERWSITITALGEARRPLGRAGAKPGDRLILVGELGAAALGLRRLQRGADPGARAGPRGETRGSPRRSEGPGERAARMHQLKPRPWIEEGQLAAGFASAAIDVSDGLLQDLTHLCARSGCGAELELDALPRSSAVRRAEGSFTETGWPLSLAGGEDYALLLAVPARRLDRFRAAFRARRFFEIGRITRPPRGAAPPIQLLERGAARPLPARLGHDHLASG